jgi:hypothetical protein
MSFWLEGDGCRVLGAGSEHPFLLVVDEGDVARVFKISL